MEVLPLLRGKDGFGGVTMTDYIPREAVIDCIDKAYDPGYDLGYCVDNDMFKDMIKEIPAADVQPVVHGKWIDKKKKTYGMQTFCSACGQHSGIGGIESNRHKPYCPNCGAKMDLEDGS
jgi:hypothetical protein